MLFMKILTYLPKNLIDIQFSFIHVIILSLIFLTIVIIYGIHKYNKIFKNRPEEF